MYACLSVYLYIFNIYVQLNHSAIQLRLTQPYKASIHQYKIKVKK